MDAGTALSAVIRPIRVLLFLPRVRGIQSQNAKGQAMDAKIIETIREILPEIIELRRELHSHPELGFEEQWTSDRVGKYLDDHGIAHQRGLAGGTGILATLGGVGGRTVHKANGRRQLRAARL